MPKINVLDISVANLIAAGEVVERPASVVKELLENSVDAGATQITVEIKRGGITFIRVADNGCGIAREDVPVALKRHATSKITDASDLASIMTLGFRGEALAAISSVAHVRIITRTREEHVGTLLQSNPDGEVELSDTGAPVGTTVIVEELFANVPARLKFLKKDTGEAMAVTAIVEKLALSRPDIAIRYISDGSLKFETAGTGRLEDAIYAVLGRDFARSLVPVDEMTEGIYVSGFVGAPESARGNRNYENVFVNGRYVKSLTVSTAVEQAFESYIPGDRFPVCVLSVAIHPSLVDVNVHPTKLEVKFSNERAVFEAVYCAVRNALMTRLRHVKLDTPQVKLTGDDLGAVAEIITERLDKNERDGDLTRADILPDMQDDAADGMSGDTAPSQAVGDKSVQKSQTAGDNSAQKSQGVSENSALKPQATVDKSAQNPKDTSDKSAHKTDMLPSPPRARDFTLVDSAHVAPSAKKSAAVELDDILANIDTAESLTTPETSDLSTDDEPVEKSADEAEIVFDPDVQFRVAGILFNCYIIVESGERVFIIDKHAAHERILFEDMKKRLRGQGDAQAQLMFIPIELSLSPQERAAVAEFTAEFDALGYGYTELDNGKTGLIQIPADLPPDAAGELFATLASSLADGSGTPRSERDALYERALYTASCKAAMKAGRDDGGNASLSWLVRRVLTDSAVRVCPHGRPVAVEADKSWLARLFLRT